MNISLRKAGALQEVIIKEKLPSLEPTDAARIDISEFLDASEQLIVARQKFMQVTADRSELLNAYYEIRKSTAHANMEFGVSDRLTDIAFLDKKIADGNSILKGKLTYQQIDMQVIQGRINKMKASSGDVYNSYREQDITSGVLTDDYLALIKIEVEKLRIQRTKLQDETLELNIKNEIELTEETVVTFKKFNLI